MQPQAQFAALAESAEFIPVTQWPHKYPTQSAWRALIFAADTRKTRKGTIPGNGLIEAGVIRRVGRRVLVNPPRFFVWVDAGGSQKMSPSKSARRALAKAEE